jgi:cytochrome P450
MLASRLRRAFAARVAGVLAWLAPQGGISWALRPVLRKVGLAQVLTSRSSTTELLDRPDVRVPYRDRSAPLGLGGFALALDGEDHVAARKVLVEAIEGSADAHAAGLEEAAALAQGAVRDAGARVDAVRDLLEPALFVWAERWFGLPRAGPDLLLTGRLVLHATFLNPKLPNARVDLSALRLAVDRLEGHRRELVTDMAQAPEGSLSATLLAAVHALPEERRPTDAAARADLAARHLQGLTVGPLALVHRTVADAMDRLLREPWRIDAAGDPDEAARAFLGALRADPPLPGVLRTNPAECDVHGGSGIVTVPAGLVLAATACPARRGDVDGPELAFGHGVHRCLGEQHTVAVATAVLGALASRRPRRIWGPGGWLQPATAPSGVRDWPFSRGLRVALR